MANEKPQPPAQKPPPPPPPNPMRTERRSLDPATTPPHRPLQYEDEVAPPAR
jgi:hypothetical protein